jgi:nucleotide-binding universal stress UspA family protein
MRDPNAATLKPSPPQRVKLGVVTAGAPSHVLVLYRRSVEGDRALREAFELARVAGSRLTVLSVALVERVKGRCCGIQSPYWNRVMRERADEDLQRATHVLDGAPSVEFAVACGSSVGTVLAREAAERGCDTIVVPRRGRGLRRRLVRRTDCEVLELPASPG